MPTCESKEHNSQDVITSETKQYRGLGATPESVIDSESTDKNVCATKKFFADKGFFGSALVIHPRCKNLIFEFEHYRYPEPEAGSAMPESPKKVDDHALDALRYLVAALKKRTRWQVLK